MNWIFTHAQLLLNIYTYGAVIVGSLSALILFLGFCSDDENNKLNPIEVLLYYLVFVCNFLLWPAATIRIVGACVFATRQAILNHRRNKRRRFY